MRSATRAPILVLLVLTACGAGPDLSSESHVAVGQSMPYSLYTHCGILSIELNGHTYYAQPPLGHGSGNPPPGWGNPYDDGTLTTVDVHHAEFRHPAGHAATFTDTPAEAIPAIPICS